MKKNVLHMDALIIFTRSTVETFHLPSSLVVVSQWVTYIFFLLVVVYCVAHCVISDTSYVSVWFYKQRIIHAQRNANMYLQRYVFIQKQIERGNFSAKNNEFEIIEFIAFDLVLPNPLNNKLIKYANSRTNFK